VASVKIGDANHASLYILEMVQDSIGVILGEDGGPDPHVLEWEDGPPLYKYTKSDVLLGPLTSQTKATPLQDRDIVNIEC